MSEQRHRILTIDDSQEYQALLQCTLEQRFEVLQAQSGLDGLRLFYRNHPDLVVLDARMPEMDGWETLRRIRELADTPVIMLTGLADDASVIRGLRLGADDYVAKPVSPTVFEARVEALLRRITPGAAREPSSDHSVIQLYGGQLTIDRRAGQVWARGELVQLSPKEYRLLVYLAEQSGRVLSQSQILRQVWGPEHENETNYVKTYISMLRAKVEADPRHPRYILSRRGLGYLLAAGNGHAQLASVG